MKEVAGYEPVPQVLPTVTYDDDGLNKLGWPFTFEINRSNLARFMSDELGLSPEKITQVKIHISPDTPKAAEIVPQAVKRGYYDKDALVDGETAARKDKDGFRQINIYAGPSTAVFFLIKSHLDDYTSQTRSESGQPFAALITGFLENSLQGYIHTKRLSAYLRSVDRQRANNFLDKFLARKFADQLADTLVHETSHLTDADERESAINQSGKNIRLSKIALLSGAAINLSSLAVIVTHNHDIALGMQASSLILYGTSYLLARRSHPKNELADTLYVKSEEKAQSVANSSKSHLIGLVDIKLKEKTDK